MKVERKKQHPSIFLVTDENLLQKSGYLEFWWGQALQPNGTQIPAWTLPILANIQKGKRITDQSCNMKLGNLLSLLHLVPLYCLFLTIDIECP
jgi:hypothetical protein